jgi:hypothetical protein
MTPFLQPADQSWMRPLKLSYQRKWNNWTITATKAYTLALGYARVVELIAETWDELDSNLIARSFKYCGVATNNLADYGSQLRHCHNTEDTIVNEDLGLANAGD